MDKIVLLKTQLVEAARLGKSNDFRFKRLAVILLDNFVEIQLSALINDKFMWDGAFLFQEKKYKQKDRKRILNHFDELLKACVSEGIITKEESFQFAFCHGVRNNLYHKIGEEELMVDVALRILHVLISLKQPEWKSARGVIVHTMNSHDPYVIGRKKTVIIHSNSTEEWKYFLEKYFRFIDRRTSGASILLGKSILKKMKDTRLSYDYIKKEFHVYFPYAADWEFNDFLLEYSFKNIYRDKIEEIKEAEGRDAQQQEYEKLFFEYKSKWRNKKFSRIKDIEVKAKDMSKLTTFQSLEKYISLRNEFNLIYEAMSHAAGDFDGAVQHAIDVAKGN